MRFRSPMTAALVAVLVLSVGTAVGAVPPRHSSIRSLRRSEPPVVTRSADGLLRWTHVVLPGVIEAGRGLYLMWVTTSSAAPQHEELARVDPTSGAVTARRAIDGLVIHAVVNDASLFVLVQGTSVELLRLDLPTLRQSGRWRIGGPAGVTGSPPSIVVAGGGLWIARGSTLVRFTAERGEVTTSLALEGAASAEVATTRRGSVLLVGEANESGVGHIQRRDAVTGNLLSESPAVVGVASPSPSSVATGVFWVGEATGMMGDVRLYSLAPLGPVGTCRTGARSPTCVVGTNGITARVEDDVLFVTQTGGGPTENFCGNVDGHVLARLPVKPSESVLAVGRTVLFLWVPAARGRTSVAEARVPRACR